MGSSGKGEFGWRRVGRPDTPKRNSLNFFQNPGRKTPASQERAGPAGTGAARAGTQENPPSPFCKKERWKRLTTPSDSLEEGRTSFPSPWRAAKAKGRGAPAHWCYKSGPRLVDRADVRGAPTGGGRKEERKRETLLGGCFPLLMELCQDRLMSAGISPRQ